MIARIWRGMVPTHKADDYYAYLLRTGIPDYRATAGNRGVQLLRRSSGDVTEFQLISLWESWDAIRQFAGDAVEQAHYYPEDAAFLLELTPTVDHYEFVPLPDTPAPIGDGERA
jgi:hypothetical protein